MVKRVVLIVVSLFVIFGVAAGIVFRTDNSDQPDFMYVNLRDEPVYIAEGFDLADTNRLPNLSDGKWIIMDDPNREVLVQQLGFPNVSPRKFLSPKSGSVGEYTLLIGFDISDDMISSLQNNRSLQPGIYLAGISDNWEVFLNGDKIRSEIHLDSEGNIESHRNRRGTSFPFDKSLLFPGTNYLSFRIIGSSPAYTGLYYVSPYYIDSYEDITQKNTDAVTIVFCTVYIFVGLYHLLLFFMRRNEKYNLYYSLFSTTVGIYFICRSPIIYQFVQDSAITQRMEYASLYILLFLLAAFTENLTIGRLKLPTKIYGGFVGLFVLLQSVFSLEFATDLLRVWQIFGLIMMLYVISYDFLYVFFSTAYQKWKNGSKVGRGKFSSQIGNDILRTPLGNILITMLILAATAIFDTLDSMVIHSGVVLTRYSFFLVTVGAAFILGKYFGNMYNEVNRAKTELETLVTERTKALAAQVVISEAASRAKSDFMATMSHEIRTPLNAIIGLSDIELQKELPDKTYDNIRKIRSSGSVLLSIINDILDISKIEAGSYEIISVDYDMQSLIKESVLLNIVRIGDKPIKFELEADENISVVLYGDELRIKQIITNLLSNAFKYTKRGSVKLSVKQEPHGQDAVVCIKVSDTGIGIKNEDLGKLFSEYSQLDTKANRKIEGTGLGLSITKKLVELMDGTIEAESVYGEGSVFTVRLPQRITNRTPIGKENAERLNSLSFLEENVGKSRRDKIDKVPMKGNVLVVDDVEINLEVARGLLESYGITVTTVPNGRAAIDLVAAGKPVFDIILMDHMMPEMDGIETTHIIRNEIDSEYAKTVPIIALTANALSGNNEMFLSKGFDYFISKPIDIVRLDEALKRWILNKK